MKHTFFVALQALQRWTPQLALAAVILSCGFLLVRLASGPSVSAQAPSKRSVDVTVTDPFGRFVTGLNEGHFDVIENGVRRAISGFSDAASPISIVIVSDEPLPDISTLGPLDELIQTPSVANGIRQLAASQNARKAIITTAPTAEAIPSGIQLVQADRGSLRRTMIELRSQYRLEFESSAPGADVQVVLNAPRGLPPLKVMWK